MIEIWLTAKAKRIRLPVLPEKISLEAGGQHERVTLHEAGEALLIGKRRLRALSIGSYFPARYTSVCAFRNIPEPQATADLLRSWAEGGVIVKLVIAGGAVDVSMPVVIESFSSSLRKVSGDVEYEMSLTEYVTLDVTAAAASVFTLHPRPRPRTAPTPPTNTRYTGTSRYPTARPLLPGFVTDRYPTPTQTLEI